MNVRAIPFNPNPLCGVCGPAPRIRELSASNYPGGDSRTLSSGDSRTLPAERCFV